MDMQKRHSLIKSFGFAFEGIKTAFTIGRNFKIQIVFGILALILAFFLKLSLQESVDLILIIALVLILELINTAVEATVDLASPERREKAKIAKDVAAAAVFIASLTSIAVAALLFLPKIF